MRDVFLTLDKNKDGSLTVDELKEGLKKLCTLEFFQQFHTGHENCHIEIMNTCDLNGDGKIDY